MRDRQKARPSRETADIWDKPNIKAMLKERPGSPISLTRAEAMKIADAAFGARPDLPPGAEYVRGIKHIWRGFLRDRRVRRSS